MFLFQKGLSFPLGTNILNIDTNHTLFFFSYTNDTKYEALRTSKYSAQQYRYKAVPGYCTEQQDRHDFTAVLLLQA